MSRRTRVLLAGSGPLILALTARLRRHGVPIVAVREAAPVPGPAAVGLLTRAAAAR